MSLVIFNNRTRYRDVYDRNIHVSASVSAPAIKHILVDELYTTSEGSGRFVKVQHGIYVNLDHVCWVMIVYKGDTLSGSIRVGKAYKQITTKISRRHIRYIAKIAESLGIPVNRSRVYD